jgi:hypothetical protein
MTRNGAVQMTLSETLNQKIDRLIDAYEYLKSENQMLREELLASKLKLQEQENEKLVQDEKADIKEEDIEAIISKLELALGQHE